MDYHLEIVIPTYNRIESLNKTLAQIYSTSLSAQWCVTVIDNCSPADVASSLLPEAVDHAGFCFKQNNENIGICGNIIKCFEQRRAKWLWILGDDDDIDLEILEEIVPQLEGDFCNFSSDLFSRSEKIKGRGLREFVSKIDSYSNCLFLSTSFYRVDAFRNVLANAYLNTASFAPQIAFLLEGLDKGSTFILSEKKLIKNREKSVPSWSIVEQSLNFTSFLYTSPLVKQDLINEFFQKMIANEIKPRRLFLSFILYAKEKKLPFPSAQIVLARIFAERYRFSSPFTKLEAFVFRIVFQALRSRVFLIFNLLGLDQKLSKIRA